LHLASLKPLDENSHQAQKCKFIIHAVMIVITMSERTTKIAENHFHLPEESTGGWEIVPPCQSLHFNYMEILLKLHSATITAFQRRRSRV
jgi:hypothetical protein